MERFLPSQIADVIPRSIAPDDDPSRRVQVCGSACVDADAVALALRAAGVAVDRDGCHGTRGGCSSNGVLGEGAYASVPTQTEQGVVMTEVVVSLQRTILASAGTTS